MCTRRSSEPSDRSRTRYLKVELQKRTFGQGRYGTAGAKSRDRAEAWKVKVGELGG